MIQEYDVVTFGTKEFLAELKNRIVSHFCWLVYLLEYITKTTNNEFVSHRRI